MSLGGSTSSDGQPTASAPAPRTVAHMFGEIVWIMTRSPVHKHLSLADLEWTVMPALMLEQYRLFHEGTAPVGVAIWAFLSDEVAARMQEPNFRLRPDQWRSGTQPWVIDVVVAGEAIARAQLAMLQDLRTKVFPTQTVWTRRVNAMTQQVETFEIKPEDPTAGVAEPPSSQN